MDRALTHVLATRGARLIAWIFDLAFLALALLMITILEGRDIASLLTEPRSLSRLGEIADLLPPALLYFLVNGYLLSKRGQSVGKFLVGIKIVDVRGTQSGLVKLFLIRWLPFYTIQMVPVIGQIVFVLDVIAILRNSRRCLHDSLVKTTVVVA